MYQRDTTELDRTVTSAFLNDYIATGCVPASEIAVVKAPGPSLNRDAFMTDGRTDPDKLRKLYRNGYTLRLGNLQRVIPFMARVSRAIQEETGYSNYVHAFLTPPGNQGLRHHWDQQMAVIVQAAGVKRWQLWRPPVEAPMREFNESWRVWRSGVALAERVHETRDALVRYLAALDVAELALLVRQAAVTELEYTT
ncbi:hypothetical protein CU044_1821 [Streptomyces sp. L-9-10]|uniref:JmjC domain-containing protein n=1 Tax=Streptomyces sp. L-9-10 TaxID=1478131 RepID=UPI00101E1BB7|nr:cupin domain-containing protein [Streptomyces sp. L-9-10]RYJ29701.1 hypothetical protein CU044_1821 [Streptomyces sp. L-9-10]